MIWKLPATILGLPFSPAACASKSAVGKYRVCVLSSIHIVRAPLLETTFSTTENLSLDASFITVIVPVPFEVYTCLVVLSNATPSQPSPIGKVAITFPFSASKTTSCFSQPANNLFVFASIYRPVGDSPGRMDQ